MIYAFEEDIILWRGEGIDGNKYTLRRALICTPSWGYVLTREEPEGWATPVEAFFDGEFVNWGHGAKPIWVYDLPEGIEAPPPSHRILTQMVKDFALLNEGRGSEIVE